MTQLEGGRAVARITHGSASVETWRRECDRSLRQGRARRRRARSARTGTLFVLLAVAAVASAILLLAARSSHAMLIGGPVRAASAQTCESPAGVVRLVFSREKYPNIYRHWEASLDRGWPIRYIIDRDGASARRDRALRGIPTRRGFDRDEEPPAVGRGVGRGLEYGSDPVGWQTDVDYVPSGENRSHGAVLGHLIENLCDGVRIRYVFKRAAPRFPG